jgi:hypothetical protein
LFSSRRITWISFLESQQCTAQRSHRLIVPWGDKISISWTTLSFRNHHKSKTSWKISSVWISYLPRVHLSASCNYTSPKKISIHRFSFGMSSLVSLPPDFSNQFFVHFLKFQPQPTKMDHISTVEQKQKGKKCHCYFGWHDTTWYDTYNNSFKQLQCFLLLYSLV